MMFREILDDELLDEEFCEYLEKGLNDKVVDDLQTEIQVLIGNIVPRFYRKYLRIFNFFN